MLVFRDGRRELAVPPLSQESISACRRVASGDRTAVLAALLRAGELECLLLDADSPAAEAVAAVTDSLAAALAGGDLDRAPFARLERIAVEALPPLASGSVPEGFAYYALHPLDYADATAGLTAAKHAAVVGIRSIGTTLGAVTAAALGRRGVSAARIAVRPTGHPWDRAMHFSPAHKHWIEQERAQGAEFLVVDEGPGLSGSSFLAVAEALVAAGVPRERITLLGSHAVDPEKLCARDAAARWGCFRFVAVAAPSRLPGQRAVDLSGGEWRGRFLAARHEWPASWTQFERAKCLSADGKKLFKFEGLGPYGAPAFARSRQLAEDGLGPQVEIAADGFLAYECIAGRSLRRDDADERVLRRIAEYCAARSRRMPAEPAKNDGLSELVAVNWREAFGDPGPVAHLPVERPVIADGRMHPHEWVRTPDGAILKTDGAAHGDDHFFPGPTDIAWDLAGAIVEWDLDGVSSACLLEHYRRLAQDDARDRLPGYLLAYTLFRLGYAQMAAQAMRGGEEESRLRNDELRYRGLAARLGAARLAA